MISRGGFEMQSMQMCALKQTMLSQETVFRKQVLELHHLYGIQKTLMHSSGFYDYGGHGSSNERDDAVAMERNLFSVSGRVRHVVAGDLSLPFEILEKKRRQAGEMGKKSCSLSENHINLEESIQDKHISRGFSDSGQIHLCTAKKEDSDAGLLDLNEAYPDDSSCNSNDPTDIAALRLSSGNIEYSDDQTKEQRIEDVGLFCGPKSGNMDDNNRMCRKNDSASVAEAGPDIVNDTPIVTSSACDQVSGTTISADEEVSAEKDPSIQNAAISLVIMSTQNSARETKHDQPQCSSDSFEMIALKLRQTSADDYSVSSRPTEKDGDKKDYSLKLRRGRRLKDFQKEILPGLATLSRHEICEDVNILEAVLRSREYKKTRANMAEDGRNKWHPPVRSKRSSVRRRLW